MYLYGWPVLQVARAMMGDGAPWWAIFAAALPAAAMLGLLSWHLLEKRALRLKHWRPSAMPRRNAAIAASTQAEASSAGA
jgi:peptidoglycan/LPS O-acetylase OafA/YrhL